MPLPLLLGGAAIFATVVGASSYKDAHDTNEKAERVSRQARNLYNESKESLENAKNEAEKKLLQLGYTKKNALDGAMKQFVQVYDRIKNIQLKKSSGLNEISQFSIEQQDVVQIRQMTDIYSSSMQSGAAGAATGAVIALAASGSLPMVTSALSLAGTCLSLGSVGAAASIAGTAISTAFTATPLAAVVAPAIFFTGVSASMKADENLEKAEEMYAEAEKASEEMKISETLCTAIGERSKMFDDLLVKLNGMFTDLTDMLSNMIREKDRLLGDKEIEVEDLSEEELELVAVTRALAGAVKAIVDTPILGKDGKVSGESLEIYNTSRKTLPDFSRIVYEMKGMQGIDVEKLELEEAEKLFIEYKLDDAFEIFKTLSEKGNGRAMYFLGEYYAWGFGTVKEDMDESKKWSLAGRDAGDALASLHVAYNLPKNNQERENIFPSVFKEVLRLAESGDVFAQYEVAYMYKDGYGTDKDEKEVIRWLSVSANEGFWRAQHRLATVYRNKGDYQQAYGWYKKAADTGYGLAQYWLGRLLDSKDYLEQNEEEANKWYRKAANQNVMSAMVCLGINLRYGIGCDKDYEEAIKLFERAASLGSGVAANQLGSLYHKGEWVEQNYEKAISWYKKASELGSDSGMCNLANCYYAGCGVSCDYDEAKKWWKKSAELGNQEAKESLSVKFGIII